MDQIINEEALLEDSAEGLADLLNIDMVQAAAYLTDDNLAFIIEKMFDGQSEALQRIKEETLKDTHDIRTN